MSRKSFNSRRIGCVLAVAAFAVAAPGAAGMSGTSMAASAGQPVSATLAEIHGWPEGTLAILNDPLRGDGWNPWFTEWPNDLNHYEMRVKSTEDVQHLIDLLVKIKGSPVQIFLDPRDEPSGLGFTTTLPEGNGIGAMFSIGSQKQIDQWYGHLEEAKPGVRKFGGYRLQQPPGARPPTLTLYVGNDAVDLATLRIPAKVEARAGYNDKYREEHKDDKVLQEIEKFVKEHRVKTSAEVLKAAATVAGATEE